MRRPSLLGSSLPLLLVGLAACEGPPDTPAAPTWAHVEPILRAQCNHCHGATARETGAAGSIVYRFDFFDVDDGSCGEAAQAMSAPGLARGWAKAIKMDVTPTAGHRPRMPPAPAPPLDGWERETLQRWGDRPEKGAAPARNRKPGLRVRRLPAVAGDRLSFDLVLEDPDGEPVIGVLKIGADTLKMDRPGAFGVELDTSAWPAGARKVTAVLCDGWGATTVDVGQVEIRR
jgi:hypothetical protein